MEKKLRARTIKTVLACAIMFLAISSLVGYITWAAVTSQFKFGGNITFTATGVEATIHKTGLTGTTAEGKFNDITFDPNEVAPDYTSWTGLDLKFGDDATDIVLTFTITNNNADRKLKVAISETGTTGTNMTMTIAQTGGTEDTDYKSVTIDESGSATYTITFHVKDKADDANITGFNLQFDLSSAS